VFDGVGAAMIIGALVAEMKGAPWSVPPPPAEGMNANPLVDFLERELQAQKPMACKTYSLLGFTGFWSLAAVHLWETWWGGAERRVVVLPKRALAHLVASVRAQLVKDNRAASHVSSGDVIVAWMWKTVYSRGAPPQTAVHCTNVAAIRTLLAKEPNSEGIAKYAHNAFIPIPYPVFKASDMQAFSLADLTSLIAASRLSLSKEHVVSAYARVREPTIIFPTHEDADDDLMVSNVSASRILEADWTLVGAERTICGYRYQLTPTGVVFTNAIYIAGRLGDGSVVLDVCLNATRYNLVLEEVHKLLAASAEPSSADAV